MTSADFADQQGVSSDLQSSAAQEAGITHDKAVDPALRYGQEVLARTEIPEEYKWDLSAMFPSLESWQATLAEVKSKIPQLRRFQGTLGESKEQLLTFFKEEEALSITLDRLYMYAYLEHCGDTELAEPRERFESICMLATEFSSIAAFQDPELIAIGQDRLGEFMAESPELAVYEKYFENLFRMQAHVRSAEVEEIVAQAYDVLGSPRRAYEALNDTDLKFESVQRPLPAQPVFAPLTQGSVDRLLSDPDRGNRRRAHEQYWNGYLEVDDTMAALLQGTIHGAVFHAKVHNFPSSLAAALISDNIPEQVFNNVIDSVTKNLPTWHRYWRVRAEALGIPDLREYDVHAPLCSNPPQIAFPRAIEMGIEALHPLGEDYCRRLKQGLVEERWADIFPNTNKTSGAFSWGSYGTYPYILQNYDNRIQSVSDLFHEAGHSMHTDKAFGAQPHVYAGYSTLVAETASNLNQALLRAHLLEQGDRDFKLAVLDETFYNFHRYLFTMPILARFERECHRLVEAGEGLSAARLKEMMTGFLKEGYGDAVEVDPERTGMFWAAYSHLHAPFYVFSYTGGISAANSISADLLAGRPGARERYLEMLTFGESVYPLPTLLHAGCDLSTSAPIDKAFEILSSHIDRLESLI